MSIAVSTPNFFQCLDWDTRTALWMAGERPYRPQPYQETFHREMWPEVKAVGGGTGAAKTFTIVRDYDHEVLVGALRGQAGLDDGTGCTGRIAITGPSYKQPTQAFGYIRQVWEANDLLAGEPSTAIDRSWTMKSKTGVEVVTISGTNPAAFATKPYTVVHITEAAQQDSAMFDAALERVSRWPGEHPGVVYCEGTFEPGKDGREAHPWYAERALDWDIQPNDWRAKWFEFASWLNEYNYPGGFASRKIQKMLAHYKGIKRVDLFWTRQGGKPPKQMGDLWGEHFFQTLDGRPHHVDADAEFDPRLPVDLFFDPATHRYVVFACQWYDHRTLMIFDQIDHQNASFQKIRDDLLAKPWFRNVQPPHSLVVGDTAMRQRHQGQEHTTLDLWKAKRPSGLGLVPVGRRIGVDAGAEVVRIGLSGEFYAIKIHPRCAGLISDFRKERRDEHGIINPHLNRGNDDGRKALSYYLMHKVGAVPRAKQKRRKRPPAQHHMIRGA